MNWVCGFAAVVVMVLCAGCGEQTPGARNSPGPQSPISSPAHPTEKPKPSQGKRAPYGWLNDYTPSDTYTVALVRGLTASEALRALGVVRRDAGRLTWAEVSRLQDDLTNPRTYSSPPVVQVDEIGEGVFIYSPYGFRPFDRLVALSDRGVAGAFVTTVELDTSIRIAKAGRLVREFDPFFYDRHERKGALREEKGLGFGGHDTFGPSWRLLDRLTSLHVEQDWFLKTPHPTYVLAGRN